MKTTTILWLLLCGCAVDDVAISHWRGPAPSSSSAADASSPVVPDVQGRDPRPDSSLLPDLPTDHQSDLAESLDLPTDLLPDLDLGALDSSSKRILGTRCGSPSQCASGHCTDGVCCQVAECHDTCVPSSINSCPVYLGWTCAPAGTCRAY